MSSGSDTAERLHAVHLRATRPRIAAFEAVSAYPHSDTDTIFGQVRTTLPTVSRQAIYDVLDALTSAGLLRRIQPAGHVARYETRVSDNHHHIVCRTCGVIADADCVGGDPPCVVPSDGGGFVLHEAEVIFWGTCPGCTDP